MSFFSKWQGGRDEAGTSSGGVGGKKTWTMARWAFSFVSPPPPTSPRSSSPPLPCAPLLLQAALLLLMSGGEGPFAAAANLSASAPPGTPLAPRVPASSSSGGRPAADAAAAGASAGRGPESHAAAAAANSSVCFHLRSFAIVEGGEEAATEGGEIDPNRFREEVLSVKEVCINRSDKASPPPATQAASAGCQGGGRGVEQGQGTPVSSATTEDSNSAETTAAAGTQTSGVSAARQQFYLSSPSGIDWLLQLRQTVDFKRRELLHEPSVLIALAAAALPGWSACPREAVSLSVISGGLSNKLYLVELHVPQQQESGAVAPEVACGGHSHGRLLTKALIRVYGHQEGTALFNAEMEQKLFKALGFLGIAPRCLAEFEGGRFEEFWEATPLTTTDLTDVKTLEKAAKLISSFHAVNLPEFSACPQTLVAAAGEQKEEAKGTKESCCCCMCRLELWGRLALEAVSVVHQQTSLHAAAGSKPISSSSSGGGSSSSSSSAEEDLLLQQTGSRLDALQVESYVREAAWLTSRIREAAASDEVFFKALGEALRRERGHLRRGERGGDDPLKDLFWLSGTFPVLSHNDFQENNILQAGNTRLKLIDFEYSGVNARAFDLGNLFCEATLDYTDNPKWPFYFHRPENMPSPKLRRHLVQLYLQEMLQQKGLADLAEALLTKETISRFMRVIDLMILASHLAWGFWSVVRLEAYSAKKREIELSSDPKP
ncbi:hypothetical protein Esti_001440 [Eimeria stiedai]